MSEFVRFVNHGASLISPTIVEQIIRQLPVWKAEFAQINAPSYPHLVDQLEFLADVVEDCYEGAYKEMPYFAFAEAVFAIMYAHKKVDIIPDTVLQMGRADDSSVVRAVLIQNEAAFQKYAAANSLEWDKVTSNP